MKIARASLSIVRCVRVLQVLLDSSVVDADDEQDEGDASNTCLRLGAKQPVRAIIDAIQVRTFTVTRCRQGG